MKLSFFSSQTCQSRQHCIVCRDLEGGREMRTVWESVLDTRVPGAYDSTPDTRPESQRIDFRCPYGITLEGAKGLKCSRCGGSHSVENCPIPEGYDPRDYAKDSLGTEDCNCAEGVQNVQE